MINTKRKPVPRMHLPLRRLALCLDCDECFEITDACPACGSETWTSLGRFLEWNSPDNVSRLFGGADNRRHLIVVSRDRLRLYEQLRRALSGTPTFQVVLDRRQGERRRGSAGTATERRRRDRRAARSESSTLRWSVLVVDLEEQ